MVRAGCLQLLTRPVWRPAQYHIPVTVCGCYCVIYVCSPEFLLLQLCRCKNGVSSVAAKLNLRLQTCLPSSLCSCEVHVCSSVQNCVCSGCKRALSSCNSRMTAANTEMLFCIGSALLVLAEYWLNDPSFPTGFQRARRQFDAAT